MESCWRRLRPVSTGVPSWCLSAFRYLQWLLQALCWLDKLPADRTSRTRDFGVQHSVCLVAVDPPSFPGVVSVSSGQVTDT